MRLCETDMLSFRSNNDLRDLMTRDAGAMVEVVLSGCSARLACHNCYIAARVVVRLVYMVVILFEEPI